MRLVSIVVVLILALLFIPACGGTDEPTQDAGLAPGDMMTVFGGACAQDSDCMSNTCRSFMQLGNVCTALCTEDTMCPNGSMGQKCNMNGFCRP
jgi:hypothetical protein